MDTKKINLFNPGGGGRDGEIRCRRTRHAGSFTRKEIGFDARPHLLSSPPGEDNAANGFWLADSCPANPVARIFRKAAAVSPSPWGEGRDEGGREPFEIRTPQGQRVAPARRTMLGEDGNQTCRAEIK